MTLLPLFILTASSASPNLPNSCIVQPSVPSLTTELTSTPDVPVDARYNSESYYSDYITPDLRSLLATSTVTMAIFVMIDSLANKRWVFWDNCVGVVTYLCSRLSPSTHDFCYIFLEYVSTIQVTCYSRGYAVNTTFTAFTKKKQNTSLLFSFQKEGFPCLKERSVSSIPCSRLALYKSLVRWPQP